MVHQKLINRLFLLSAFPNSFLSFRQIISPENIPYEINKTSWPVITEIKAQHS